MTDKTDIAAKPATMRILRDLTKDQRRTYMARGVPRALVGTYLLVEGDMFGETVTKIRPSLRGIIVGDEVASIDEAVVKAAEVRDRLMAEGLLADLDEIALGIDGEAVDLEARFQEAGVRIENIVHIGTMQDGTPSEALREMIGNIEEHDVRALDAHLPFLARLHRLREDEDGDMDEHEFADEFLESARDEGLSGFLVEVSVPHITPHAGGGWSIHGGIRSLAVRYGANYRQACERALEWAEAKNEEMRQAKVA